MTKDGEKSKTEIVREGFEKACREFSARAKSHGFGRSKKTLWTRQRENVADFVHFHRHGVSYGAPATFSVDIRVHRGVRVLNDPFEGLHLNGPVSDPDHLRNGRYHLRFNARSGSTYDRCVEDLFRFFVEQCEPWFERFGTNDDLLGRSDSPLNDAEKHRLTEAIKGNTAKENIAMSLKQLGIKTNPCKSKTKERNSLTKP